MDRNPQDLSSNIRLSVGETYQTEKSSTGFVKIVGSDNSAPHPARMTKHWSWIITEYDPSTGRTGEVIRLSDDEIESISLKNFPEGG